MLFWEAPAGVGFSYCDGECPHWNDTTAAQDNAAFICGFFEKFPNLRHHDFFVAGESEHMLCVIQGSLRTVGCLERFPSSP